jgi:hypothetical protein
MLRTEDEGNKMREEKRKSWRTEKWWWGVGNLCQTFLRISEEEAKVS